MMVPRKFIYRLVLLSLFIFSFRVIFAQTYTEDASWAIPALSAEACHWVDFNNDGLADLLIAGRNSTNDAVIKIYRNDGNGLTDVSTGITNLTTVRIALYDWDRDGDIDWAVSGYDAEDVPQALFYRNEGGFNFSLESFEVEAHVNGDWVFMSVNADAYIDLVVSGLNTLGQRATQVYLGTESGFSLSDISLPQASGSTFTVFDFDVDGWDDLAMAGINQSGNRFTKIFRNTNGTGFSDILANALPSLAFAQLQTAHINNDPNPDLVIQGNDALGEIYQQVFINDNGVFSALAFDFGNLSSGDIQVGDLNNDGWDDLIFAGLDESNQYQTLVWINNQDNTFQNLAHDIPGIAEGKVRLIDLNEDGSLDVYISGLSDVLPGSPLIAGLYEAADILANSAPQVPQNLQSSYSQDTLYLSWDAPTDDTSLQLSYRVYVGEASEEQQVWPAHAIISSGKPLIVSTSLNLSRNSLKISGLSEGNYFWGVQAFDKGLKNSSFSTEATTTICYPVKVSNDTAICINETLNLSVGSAPDQVTWFSRNNGEIESGFDLSYVITEEDSLYVEIDKEYGCTVSSGFNISLLVLPSFSLGSDTAICYQEYLNLDLGEGWASVNWYSKAHGLLAEGSSQLAFQVLEADTLWAEVFNENGCVNYDTLNIGLLELPAFSLGSDTAICYQEYLNLDLGEGWASVNWYSKAQGLLAEGSSQLAYQVLEADTLWAEVFNENGCVNYDTLNIGLLNLPAFSLGSDTAICYQEYLNLDLGEGWASVNWYSKAQGLLAEGSSQLAFLVLEADTIWAEVFNENGCVNYDTLNIGLLELPAFSLGSDTAICYQEYLNLDLGEGWASINWYSKAHGLLAEGSSQLAYQVLEADTIWAEVFNENGCVNYDTLNIALLELPAFSLGSDTAICYQEYLNLDLGDGWASVNWYSKAQGLLAEGSSQLAYKVLAADTLWAEVFNENGCVNYDTLNIGLLNLPAFSLGSDTAICYQEYLNLDLGEGWASVNWYSKAHGLLAEGSSQLAFQVLEADTLWAEVFNENGCVNYDTLNIGLLNLPAFSLGSDTAICYQEYLNLDLGEGWASVNWYSKAQGLLAEGSSQLAYQVLAADTLWAEVFNANGCVNYDTLNIGLLNLPAFSLGSDTAICYQEYLNFDLGEGWASVNWYSKAQGLLGEGSSQLAYQVLAADTLWAEVFNENGCVNYDTLNIALLELPAFSLGSDTAICYQEYLNLDLGEGWASVNWYSKAQGLLAEGSSQLAYQVLAADTLWAEVFNENGCVNYDTLNIGLLNLPAFSLGSDRETCMYDELFLEVGTGWKSATWLSSQQGIIEAKNWYTDYKVMGNDTLRVEVISKDNCVNSDTLLVLANPLPSFDLGEDKEICIGDSLQLSLTAATHLIQNTLWTSKANGDFSQDNYQVTLSITSTDTLLVTRTDTKGCNYADSLIILALELPEPNLGSDRNVCEGETIYINETGNWPQTKWFDASGQILQENAPTLVWNAISSAHISIEVQDDKECSARDTVFLKVNPLPQFSLGQDTLICFQDVLIPSLVDTWDKVEWRNSTEDILSENPSFPWTIVSDTLLRARVYNEFACSFEDTLQVTMHRPFPSHAGEDALICQGESVQIGMNNPSSTELEFLWFPDYNLSASNASQVVASPEQSTWYYLQVKDTYGCFSIDSVQVLVNPYSKVEAGFDREICVGEGTVLGASPTASGAILPYTYQWYPQDQLLDPFVANPVATPTETTEYWVKVFAGDCFADSASVRVIVNPLPTISSSADTTIGAGDQLQLWAAGGEAYYWEPIQAFSNALVSNPIVSPRTTTTYQVEVTDVNGCKDNRQITVFVKNLLFIPELFSPNEDGANDRFRIQGYGFQELTLRVFDTSGQLVFESREVEEILNQGWDGKYQGKALPNGSYYWRLDGRYFDGSPVTFNNKNTGLIRLIR
ncbi:FG-GAP-like repeat-containing protein [Cytophagales bacterium LB-30]|uniref:FG-GAP-like repeat-containing protein n=1 Tax=Shiella aurantiaca TaxID=3058365 RepID=A0ABT8F0A2_9BACT|nr:FG-GAP-like repeat-containing protein [Shiella aurantiaca]MDN4163876.1 FG-GAP-like repeat-containing protein [Shiella aurantiaca]